MDLFAITNCICLNYKRLGIIKHHDRSRSEKILKGPVYWVCSGYRSKVQDKNEQLTVCKVIEK